MLCVLFLCFFMLCFSVSCIFNLFYELPTVEVAIGFSSHE